MHINPDSFIHDTLEFISKLIYENIHDPEAPTQKIRVVPSYPAEIKIPSISIFRMPGAYTKKLGPANITKMAKKEIRLQLDAWHKNIKFCDSLADQISHVLLIKQKEILAVGLYDYMEVNSFNNDLEPKKEYRRNTLEIRLRYIAGNSYKREITSNSKIGI